MSSISVLDDILASLRSSDEATRERGLQTFQDHVRSSLASGRADDPEAFWVEVINRVLMPLSMMSDTPQQKLVGIAAMDKVLTSPSDDAHPTSAPASKSTNPSASSNPSAKRHLHRLFRYLKNLLPDPSLQVMAAASRTYGTILRVGGQGFAEIWIVKEIQEAVGLISEKEGEWSGAANRALTLARLTEPTTAQSILSPSSSGTRISSSTTPSQEKPQIKKTTEKEKIFAPHARIAGLLILTQIAKQVPDMYYQHVELILSRIMHPLRDPSRFLVVSAQPLLGLENTFDFFSGRSSFGVDSAGEGTQEHGKMDPPFLATLAGKADSKPSIQPSDVPRRLAAALFGATLEVIKEREGIVHSEGEDLVLPGGIGVSGGGTITRTTTFSTMDPNIMTPSIGPSYSVPGGAGGSTLAFGGMHVSRPLVNVAVAACNDIANYLRSSTGVPHSQPQVPRGRYMSTPSQPPSHVSASLPSAILSSQPPLPQQSSHLSASGRVDTALPPQGIGDVNRAFGALLLYRELFGSGGAALAGIVPEEFSTDTGDGREATREYLQERRPSSLIRGGKRFVGSEYAGEASEHLRAATAPSAHHQYASTHSQRGRNQGGKEPLPYPTIFADVFTLMLRFPAPPSTSSGFLSGSALGGWLGPSSPTWSGQSPTTATSFSSLSPTIPNTSATISAALSGGVLGPEFGPYAGHRFNSPLPSLSKYDQEETLRKEALSLMPVLAAYDVRGFLAGGWARRVVGVVLGGWGIEGYANPKGADRSGRRTDSSASFTGRPASYAGRPPMQAKMSDPSIPHLEGLEGPFDDDDWLKFGTVGITGATSGKKLAVPIEKGDRSYLVRVLGELMFALRSSKKALLEFTWEIGIVLHGALESRVPLQDLWSYNGYYSPSSLSARSKASSPTASPSVARNTATSTRIRTSFIDPSKDSKPLFVTTSDTSRGERRKLGLGGKGGKAIQMPKGCVSEEVLFGTIALLAEALGVHFMNVLLIAGRGEEGEEMDDEQSALDKMFRFGLNPPLCASLYIMCRAIPRILGGVQEHLLNEISTILNGHGYKPPGAPDTEAKSSIMDDKNGPLTIKLHHAHTATNPSLIRLALVTLQTFNWHERTLTSLIQHGVLSYMDSKDRDVRLHASLAACTLFMKDPIAHHTSTASISTIDQVIGRLVRAALADPDPEIRATVLKNLDESYDRHLAQVEHVRAISMALNDEDAAVRMKAVPILGRLAVRNPASVVPNMRAELIRSLTELEYSTDPKALITTSEVLTELLKCTERLLKPWVPSLLRVCLPKARSPLVYVSRRMMQCIGLLAQIAGEDIVPSLEEIMSLFLVTLQDPTASIVTKEVVLVSLGQVCGNTSNVVDPYIKYPELFDIFKRFLKSESKESTKRKVLQVMGILGAIDPYTRLRMPDPESQEQKPSKALQQSIKSVGAQPEVFYMSVVIQSLLSILADASLVSHHTDVIEVLLSIFKTQGMKCVPFLPQIIPAFTAMCRASNARHQDFYLQQMSLMVQIIGPHIRNYVDEVFHLTTDLWESPELRLPIVALIESLATAMAAEFKKYLPVVIPQLLTVFETPGSAAEVKVFNAMLSFGSAVEEYIHLILPVLLSTIERPNSSKESRKHAVITIGGLSRRVSLVDNASRIVHPLIRALPGADASLRDVIMNTISVLLQQLGADFAIFIPRIDSVLAEYDISAPKYVKLAETLMKGEPLPASSGAAENWNRTSYIDPVAAADMARPNVNQQELKSAWSVEHVRGEGWQKWFKRFSLQLMQESPSHALRACASLASAHEPLAKELFNAAFYSCWVELSDVYKEELVQAITYALTSSKSTELKLRLLRVVEFMEHEDKALPIDNNVLGDIAAQTNALAKALHYKEHEFLGNPTTAVVEQLIGINATLKQRDAALGLLYNEQLSQGINQLLWYEQLGRWEQAAEKYEERLIQAPDDQSAVLGQMRCFHALSEWDSLGLAMERRWSAASTEEKEELAPMATASAWVLRDWDRMAEYVNAMSPETSDHSFFKAILLVHGNKFSKAEEYISRARDALQTNLSLIDDYNRVYGTMVRAQLLSELEEIVTYKKSADQPDRQEMMRKTWVKRLQGCKHDVDTWQKVLQLRSLVISPSEDAPSYIKFANLCRKEGRWNLAESVIQQLLSDQSKRDAPIRASPAVVFTHLRLLWDTGDREDSLRYLINVCASLARDIGLDDPNRVITGNLEEVEEVRRLLSRAYLKQGEWRQELQPEWTPATIEEVIQCYQLATQLDPKWYKAWHTWALCNFEVINHLESVDDDRDEETQRKSLLSHILAAVIGFFRSIKLGGQNPIQDSLRLLTLWFKFGSDEEVSSVVADNFKHVSIDTWLEVIPQLIARIQTPSHTIRHQINSLLTQVGRVHPQALIYPLTVASKSNSQLRQAMAVEIMDRLREHSPMLVEQALLVSHELIRVAILWHELWHEYLEEASKLYFTEKKPEAMIEHLEILHRKLDQGPETTREASFVQVHGKDLREAREACHRYLKYHETADMDKAWDIYYAVFRRIEKQLPLLTTIDLQYASPKLLQAENLELAVPGTYRSGKPIVKITRFVSKLSVIASKQRPRRLAIMGSDGKEYQFCLKGHEDLRQDERVMQVFSLVNTLLSTDRQSFMRQLHIQGYAAIPLAPNVGLLKWVQHADTLHVLVSDYRAARKIHLQIEYRLMLQMAPDYVNLTMLQKLEVFKYALDNTTGQDLYRVLWLTSGDSEAWLERRSTYTRSLAVSSMVGHILGLGDRHPANLLLDQWTGKVIHIDFGDCFEIAMHREKFPEKIPFRLTRMLVSAMEVSGIDGSFKVTSEITMRVLRDNREPLMAVLEAFIYDPLVSWRLTTETEARARVLAHPDPNRPALAGEAGGAGYRYAGGPRRKAQLNEGLALNEDMTEWRNTKALAVYQRVQKKLTGRDFNPDEELTVEQQVKKLVRQATALENLCQCFPGWCPFW